MARHRGTGRGVVVVVVEVVELLDVVVLDDVVDVATVVDVVPVVVGAATVEDVVEGQVHVVRVVDGGRGGWYGRHVGRVRGVAGRGVVVQVVGRAGRRTVVGVVGRARSSSASIVMSSASTPPDRASAAASRASVSASNGAIGPVPPPDGSSSHQSRRTAHGESTVRSASSVAPLPRAPPTATTSSSPAISAPVVTTSREVLTAGGSSGSGGRPSPGAGTVKLSVPSMANPGGSASLTVGSKSGRAETDHSRGLASSPATTPRQ